MATDKKKTRFIRVKGRIVPIRGKGGASGAKKKKAKNPGTNTKKIFGRQSEKKGKALGNVIGGSLAFSGSALTRSLPGVIVRTALGALVGGVIGRAIGGITHAKRKKGESKESLAKRVSRKRK
jgi:hypothetical protein